MEKKDFLELEFYKTLKFLLFTQREKIKSGLFLQEGQGKMRDKNTTHYTRDSLPKGKTNLARLKNMSEEEIENASKMDKENPRWTKKMLASAALHMPQKKVSIHMYVDEDVIDFFKLNGRGYQTRMHSVLKSYVHKHIQKHS